MEKNQIRGPISSCPRSGQGIASIAIKVERRVATDVPRNDLSVSLAGITVMSRFDKK